MIKILTGRQTDPLQEKILEEAVINYEQDPKSKTFIIVPNHIKFTTEIKAINKLATHQKKTETAVKNLQVLSFSRLAWYFLKDAEEGLPTQLDDAASAMLLAKIIKRNQEQLLLFKNSGINSGMVKQLYDTILQIHEGNINLDDIEQTNLNTETKNKLHDLKIIYEDFLKEIAGKFSTKNEIELQLNELLASDVNLKECSFFFSDFSHFSLQELLTIKLLMNKASNITLAFKTKDGSINPDPKPGDYDYVIQNTIHSIISYLNQYNLQFEDISYPISPKLSNKEVLNGLWTGMLPDNQQELRQVQLIKADSRYAEAYFVARTIYQQVALSKYRYQDFLILAPNLHEYETYLAPILRQNKIPFFDDLQQEMKYHPLVILIENLAQLIKYPLQTQNIITILKTRLLIPSWYHEEAEFVHDVDKLENFVLAHGINHNLWKRNLNKFVKADYIKLDNQPDEIAKIERLRNFVIKQISSLIDKLKQQNDSKTAITNFFQFLVKNDVAKQLDNWRKQAQDDGDLQQAQQPEQLWNLLIELLKDYLLINPDQFDLLQFFDMLISGFREASFSQIPSTLDAVNVSEIGMVQNTGYKQVFVIGATSNNLPKIQKDPGFLSSENLDQMASSFTNDSYLEDRQNLNNLDQDYQFGLALSLAEDRVYISYPILNAANEELEPSTFYDRLKLNHAPELLQHDLPEKIQDILSFITNPKASLGYAIFLNSIEHSSAVEELVQLIKKYLPKETENILTASQFQNQPIDIGEQLAEQLYGQNLNTSVSQLETFYENSYEYFLNYGLRLRKRFENELDVIQAGNYFHETFDRLVKELKKKKLNLADIDQIELENILNQAREQMKNEGKYAQLLNDPFNQYLFSCLDKTTSKVAQNWHNKIKKTPLKARYSELSFGLGEKVRGLNFNVPNLNNKHTARLRGKMDRVDLAAFDNQKQTLAQVIDYKSSAKKFDLGLFYNGISMQMVSYLDVLNKNRDFFAKDSKMSILGAFYQTISRQVERLNSTKLISADLEIKDQNLDSKPQLLYTGLISNDPNLLKEADPLLQKASNLYSGLKITKNGKYSLPSNTNFNEEEMQLLLDYNEYLIKKAAQEILSGQIKLNPYRQGKNKSALTFSEFRDIFFFDAMLSQNQYHEITPLKKAELITKIKEKLGKEDK